MWLLLACVVFIAVLPVGRKMRFGMMCLAILVFAAAGCRAPTRTEIVLGKAQRVMNKAQDVAADAAQGAQTIWQHSKRYAVDKWDASGRLVKELKETYWDDPEPE